MAAKGNGSGKREVMEQWVREKRRKGISMDDADLQVNSWMGLYGGFSYLFSFYCAEVFLVRIAMKWKYRKCPSTDRWIKKCSTYEQWNII